MKLEQLNMFLLPEFDQLPTLFSNAGMLGTKQKFLQQQSEQLHNQLLANITSQINSTYPFNMTSLNHSVIPGDMSQNTFATKHFQSGPEEELHNCFRNESEELHNSVFCKLTSENMNTACCNTSQTNSPSLLSIWWTPTTLQSELHNSVFWNTISMEEDNSTCFAATVVMSENKKSNFLVQM